MKIALIRQSYTPFGGAERYMARLVEGLLARGHEVHIFAASWQGTSSSATLHKVPVIRLFSWLRALSFALNCRSLLQNRQFDVIFSLERTIYQDVYRAGDGCHRRWLLQKNLGKGSFSRLATLLNPLHLVYLFLERKLFTDPGLSAVIANSCSVRDDIVQMFGVNPDKIHVVRNGLEAGAFDVSDRAECRRTLAEEFGVADELRLLYVGSGFERKGVPALIRAAARLKLPFRLYIVGKGNVTRYKTMAAQLGIADRIVFTGPVSDVRRYYLGCDVFVFPTLYDPFSNAALEAMAAGLPVITTRFNGVAELLPDICDGLLIENPLDDAAIAAAIEKMADTMLRSSAAQASSAIASEYTMERNVTETLNVIMSTAR